jgi:hypothetical protein
MNEREENAEKMAVYRLAERHVEDYDELLRVALLRAGLEVVVMEKTFRKEVTELEATILERHGWNRVEAAEWDSPLGFEDLNPLDEAAMKYLEEHVG